MNIAEIRGEGRANMLKERYNDVDRIVISSNISTIESSELLEIKGIGQSTVKTLMENGINNPTDLRNADITKLKINPIAKKAIENFIKN